MAPPDADSVLYGPDIPSEADLRLLGDLKGKRVLELGCGEAACSIAFAKAGATAIGIDSSAEKLARGRERAEGEEVKVELRQSDMAELAFLRADSIDAVFSANSLQFVEDLNRVFRQVHRVLKVGAPLVFSLPHPAYFVIDDSRPPFTVARSYFERGHHTFADLYMGLNRASYRVDLILEPEPIAGAPRSPRWSEAMEWLPRTLIIRARKEGN